MFTVGEWKHFPYSVQTNICFIYQNVTILPWLTSYGGGYMVYGGYGKWWIW